MRNMQITVVTVTAGVSRWCRLHSASYRHQRSQQHVPTDSSSAIFDCKHPVDFKRTALSGRKAAGAILAVLMSTTGQNSQGDIT